MPEGFSFPDFGPSRLDIVDAPRKPRTVRQLLIDIASRQDLGGIQNLEALTQADWKLLAEAAVTGKIPKWETGNSPGGDGDPAIVYENEISFHDYSEAISRVKQFVKRTETKKKEDSSNAERYRRQEEYDVATTQWRFPKCGHIFSRGGIMAEVALRNMPLVSGNFPTTITCACGNVQPTEKVRHAILGEGYPVPKGKSTGGTTLNVPTQNEKPTASTQ